jgi:hypothetical protein
LLDGSLWKREPWFSPARKASWNDDCGRPAVSEKFGISESDLDPAGAYFCRFGIFIFILFFPPFSWNSVSFDRGSIPQVRVID